MAVLLVVDSHYSTMYEMNVSFSTLKKEKVYEIIVSLIQYYKSKSTLRRLWCIILLYAVCAKLL